MMRLIVFVLALCSSSLFSASAAPVRECGNGGYWQAEKLDRAMNITTRGLTCKQAKLWVRNYFKDVGGWRSGEGRLLRDGPGMYA